MTLGKFIVLAGASGMLAVFAYAIYDPNLAIRWAKTAHPELSEFDPQSRSIVRLIGVVGSILSIVCLAVEITSR